MSQYFSEENYKGVNLVKIPGISTKRFDIMLHNFFSTIKTISEKVNIYHFHAIGPSIFSIIPRLINAPTIVTMHSLNWKHSKWNRIDKFFIKIFEDCSVKFPEYVVTVAKQHQKYLQERHDKPIHYIPNGVNFFPKIGANRILSLGLKPHDYLLFVGRVSQEKGCHFLVETFNKMDTNKKLVIAGAVSRENKYFQQLKKMANNKVIFLGQVTQGLLSELYSNALVYILPSESEGFSLSLLEVMSNGCCIVVSAIEENLDVIGDCGLTFDPGNINMLRDKLLSIMDKEDIRLMYGEKARKRAQKFYNWDDICDSYEMLYKSCIA